MFLEDADLPGHKKMGEWSIGFRWELAVDGADDWLGHVSDISASGLQLRRHPRILRPSRFSSQFSSSLSFKMELTNYMRYACEYPSGSMLEF